MRRRHYVVRMDPTETNSAMYFARVQVKDNKNLSSASFFFRYVFSIHNVSRIVRWMRRIRESIMTSKKTRSLLHSHLRAGQPLQHRLVLIQTIARPRRHPQNLRAVLNLPIHKPNDPRVPRLIGGEGVW
jgi:hypothetical protein